VKRPRRSQGERSGEMRERLAKATFDIIAARGFSSLRTAAVAEQAGVSQGALLHHFETKDGLTLATVEYAFAQASALTEQIIADGLAKGVDPIDLMLRDFRTYFFNDDFWVSLDITINALKDPALKEGIREIVPRYRLGVYRRWVGILSENGWSVADAEEIVRMSAALTTGLGIRTLFDDVDAYLDVTLAKWRDMVTATWPRSQI
jgi:AcrR family transcriptional regulator